MTAPRFVEFTLAVDGQPIGVNIQHVVDVRVAMRNGRPETLLTLVDDRAAWVRESFPDVLKDLRGDT